MLSYLKSISLGICIILILSINITGLTTTTAHAVETVKIGIVESMTGPLAIFGQESINGAQWAADQINSEGGILNKKVDFIIRDSQSKAEQLFMAVDSFKNRDKAICVIAPFGSTFASKVISAAAEKVKLPAFISSPFTDDIFNKKLSFTFRIVPGQKLAAKQMLDYIKEIFSNAHIPLKSYVISQVQSSVFKSLSDEIKLSAQKYGLTMLDEISYSFNPMQDMTTYATRIKELRPDLIFQFGTPRDSTDLLKKLRSLRVKPQAIVGIFNIGFSNPTWVGSADNISVLSSMNADFWWNPKLKNIEELQGEYYKRFNRKLSNNALHTYIVVHILREVINKVHSLDHIQLANGIHSQMFESPLAQEKPIKFDSNGRNENAQTVLLQVSNPRPKVVLPIFFAEEKPKLPFE
jgi:ABC-type branched-subunit amino acid transport system substrate-binding protein